MTTPWNVLGIEPEGANERDVKRAYARLLKQHRPEEDPEGFTRVHDAYQQALAELAWEKEADEQDGFGPAVDAPLESPLPEKPPQPELHASGVEEGEAHEEWDGPLPFGLPPLPFHEVIFDQEGNEQPSEWPRIQTPEGTGPAKPPPVPPRIIIPREVRVKEVLADLERNDDSGPMRVLNAVLTRDISKLRIRLAKAMLEEPARFANEASTRFAIRLAMLLAFRSSSLSEGLMDMVFQVVPATQREMALAGPNFLLEIAPAFKSAINKGHWDFWCAAFSDPERIDWDSTLARFALGEADRLGYWEGYQLLDSLVPEEKQLWNQRAARGENIHQVRPAKQQKTNASNGHWSLLLWIAFIVLITNGNRMFKYLTTPEDPAPWTTMESDWTEHDDVGPFFMNAETQEEIEIKSGRVQILGKRNSEGEKVYFAVQGKHVREFDEGALQTWKDEQRLTKSTNSPPLNDATRQYQQNQQNRKNIDRLNEILRQQKARDGTYVVPRPVVPRTPPNIQVPPQSYTPPGPRIPNTRTPGNRYAPATPRAPSRGPSRPSRPSPFGSPSSPNTGW